MKFPDFTELNRENNIELNDETHGAMEEHEVRTGVLSKVKATNVAKEHNTRESNYPSGSTSLCGQPHETMQETMSRKLM